MPNKKCFVLNCQSRSNEKENLAHFKAANSELRKLWEEAIGRTGMGSNSTVCSAHFEDRCIIKFAGSGPLKRWRLRKGSVPTINIYSRDTANNSTNQSRGQPTACGNDFENNQDLSRCPTRNNSVDSNENLMERTTYNNMKLESNENQLVCQPILDIHLQPNQVFPCSPASSEIIVDTNEDSTRCSPHPDTVLEIDEEHSTSFLKMNEVEFMRYAAEIEKIGVPSSGWNWAIIPAIRLIVCSTYVDAGSYIFCKAVRMQSCNEVSFYAGEKELRLGITRKFNTLAELSNILQRFDSAKKCEGFQHSDGSLKHSENCFKISGERSICNSCTYAKNRILCCNSEKADAKKLINNKVRRLVRNSRKMQATIENSTQALNNLSEENAKLRQESLTNLVENLSTVEKEVILTFVKRAHLKPNDERGHGIRYTAQYLTHCASLLKKSNSAYLYIRNSKMIPLPSPRTLRLLLAKQKKKSGENQLALEQIE